MKKVINVSTHPDPEYREPTVSDGRAVFISYEHFGDFMAGIGQLSIDEAEAKMERKGFLTLTQKDIRDYQASTNVTSGRLEDEEPVLAHEELIPDSEEFTIVDPYFSTVFNGLGEIQIARDIIKVTNEYTYIFRLGNEDLVKRVSTDELARIFAQADNLKKLVEVRPGLRVAKVIKDDIGLLMPPPKAGTATGMAPRSFTGTVWENAYLPNHPSRRVRVRVFNAHYGLFTSLGQTTRFQRKKLGSWWRFKASELWHSWDIVYNTSNDLGVTLNNEEGEFNSSRIVARFEISTAVVGNGDWGIPERPEVTRYKTKHRGKSAGLWAEVSLNLI